MALRPALRGDACRCQRAFGGASIAQLADEIGKREQRAGRDRIAGRQGVVAEGPHPHQQLFVITRGEIETPLLRIFELREQQIRKRDREIEIAPSPAIGQEFEHRREQKRVVVEIGGQACDAVATGREQTAVAPVMTHHKIKRAAGGRYIVVAFEQTACTGEGFQGECIPGCQYLVVAARRDTQRTRRVEQLPRSDDAIASRGQWRAAARCHAAQMPTPLEVGRPVQVIGRGKVRVIDA